MLTNISKEAVLKYQEEDRMESLAYFRLEQLLKNVMNVIEDSCNHLQGGVGLSRAATLRVEESAALRKLSASINSDMTKLAEKMLLLAGEDDEQEEETGDDTAERRYRRKRGYDLPGTGQFYVRVILLGRKPDRFKESTTIPTFLEWENPSICRVPQKAVMQAFSPDSSGKKHQLESNSDTIEARVCAAFAKPLIEALSKEVPPDSIVLCAEKPSEQVITSEEGSKKTYLVVTLVHMAFIGGYANAPGLMKDASCSEEILSAGGSKRFLYSNRGVKSNGIHLTSKLRSIASSTKSESSVTSSGLIESMVGQRFPCALSRQRTIITSEYIS